MIEKQYDLAVYIGKFQPLHNGHMSVINQAKNIAKRVLILVGSANSARKIDLPFDYAERHHMIRVAAQDVAIDYLDDYVYERNQWIVDVQEAVAVEHPGEKVCIIGAREDEKDSYMKWFPQWDIVEAKHHENLTDEQIRTQMYEGNLHEIMSEVPYNVYHAMEKFIETLEYRVLEEEYDYKVAERLKWFNSPYDPVFQTVDAVVIQSGHILLVKRGNFPGVGLWAMPGGHIKRNERLKDACIRKLREETKLKVPEPVLRGSIKKVRTFDDPERSEVGRIITTAYLIKLDDSQSLPKVKGDSSTLEARWTPLSEFYNMDEQMFSDHYHIIRKLIDNV